MSGASSRSPSEVVLRHDLESLSFRVGERRGKWRLLDIRFPLVYVQIVAPERAQGPRRFLLRIDAQGYPATAPTAALWDGQTNGLLGDDHKPLAAAGNVLIGFTASCGPCLYHPIDRNARSHWPSVHQDLAWGPDSTIITFMETVHGLIHDTNYAFSRATDAQADLQAEPLEASAVRVA